MSQDSRQVLSDEIGRILSEAGVTEEQAKYLRIGFVEMIQKNTMILETTVAFPNTNELDPAVNQAREHKAIVMGITELAKMMIAKRIYLVQREEKIDTVEYNVAIHIIRNAG